MTQARVTTTAIADADIGDIANYIASDNPRAAEQFEDEIFAAQERISEFPKAGRPIEDIPGNFLVVRVSQRFHRYLIFYRIVDPSTVEIVRVLHGARNVFALLADLE